MKLLTTKELADLCRVSVRTVESWRRRGQGPRYVKLGTGQIRYQLGSVLRFIADYRSPIPTPFKKGYRQWGEAPNE